MTKAVTDGGKSVPNRPKDRLHILDDLRRYLEATFAGFETLTLDPSPKLRQFRHQLQRMSDEAVPNAWISWVRAMDVAVNTEMVLHGPDDLRETPGISSIRRGVEPWGQPTEAAVSRMGTGPRTTPTAPFEIRILVEGPDGPVEIIIAESEMMKQRLWDDLLRTMAKRPQDD